MCWLHSSENYGMKGSIKTGGVAEDDIKETSRSATRQLKLLSPAIFEDSYLQQQAQQIM